MDKDELERVFVGDKYDEFEKMSFSIPALFFGGLYYAYRKMYGTGLVFFVITIFLTSVGIRILDSNFWLASVILFSASYSLFFKVKYKAFYSKKVHKIASESSSQEEAIKKCQEKGGTSLLLVVIVLIVGIMIQKAIPVGEIPNNNISRTMPHYEEIQKIGNEIEPWCGKYQKDNAKLEIKKTGDNVYLRLEMSSHSLLRSSSYSYPFHLYRNVKIVSENELELTESRENGRKFELYKTDDGVIIHGTGSGSFGEYKKVEE